MPRIMKSLNNISRCQMSYRTDKLSEEGICACHHAFILVISKKPGMSQEEISKEICLNKSTVTRALTHLEKHGYIIRKPNPEDKREFLVFPTDKMRAVLPKVRAIAGEWNDGITRDISEEEMEIFLSVLYRIEIGAKKLCGASK